MSVRLGWIDYLNSLPIYHGLATGHVPHPGIELIRGAPTQLNRMLAEGELDVSPISSVEYARHADELVLLPDLSINSSGFVHSVSLFFRNSVDSLHGGRVCVTGESATSDILLKILLATRLGIDAQRVKGEPDLEEIGKSYEGVLYIGDNAMKAALAYPNLGRLDLGDEWTRWTGTPMVFAVWAARRDFVASREGALRAVHRTLLAGKAWGRAHKSEIVDHARKKLFLSRAYMERYFRDLHYDLDAPKLAGLRRYYEEAHALGEVPRVPALAPLEVSA
ncbi:MAG TPA: menaquinone biosynthesis protein [Candidatus Thermoplasmatota archaeon]|nr:menaquinone biosynthesis protein [Candidatus Thermoplasmatota archaeon]